jgi:hypothetical protein
MSGHAQSCHTTNIFGLRSTPKLAFSWNLHKLIHNFFLTSRVSMYCMSVTIDDEIERRLTLFARCVLKTSCRNLFISFIWDFDLGDFHFHLYEVFHLYKIFICMRVSSMSFHLWVFKNGQKFSLQSVSRHYLIKEISSQNIIHNRVYCTTTNMFNQAFYRQNLMLCKKKKIQTSSERVL